MNLTQKRELVTQFLIQQTSKIEWKYKEEASNELSIKAQHIKELIESGEFGCRAKSVAKLVSTIIGEKIPIEDEDEDDVNVDMKCNELVEHPYSVAIDDEGMFTFVGSDDENEEVFVLAGNSVSSNGSINGNVRIATEKEIKAFVKSLNEKILNKVFVQLFWLAEQTPQTLTSSKK